MWMWQKIPPQLGGSQWTWTRRCWRWVGPTYLAPSSRPSPSPTPCQGDRRHRDHEHCQQYLARAAVNSASGVRTPMNGLFTGALVILCLAFLMPYCAFIPKVKQDLKNNQNLQDHKTFWVTPEHKTLKLATTCSNVSGHWSHFHEDYEWFLLCKALLDKCWPNLHLNKSSRSCLCQRFKRVPRWNYGLTSGPCAQIVVFAEELIIQATIAADHNQAHVGNLIWQNSPWRRHFSLQLWIGSSSWLIERKVSWSKQSTRFWLKFSSLMQSLR